jgi:hypothetical protein
MSISRHKARAGQQELSNISRRWILRLLAPLSGHSMLVNPRGFSNDHVAQALGLGEWVDPSDREFDQAAVRARLRELQRQSERRDCSLPPVLRANVDRLAALVGMCDSECRILEFATLLHHERVLDNAADTLGTLSSSTVVDVLAKLLDLSPHDVRSALGPQGVLARSGLLNVDRSGSLNLRSKLDLLSNRFADSIIGSDTDPIALLRDTVAPSAPGRLSLDDFRHLGEGLAILRPYLAQSVAVNRQGVNILVYGAPGTGKSELARALAAELGCELFEVASEDEDGDPVNGERRLRAYRAARASSTAAAPCCCSTKSRTCSATGAACSARRAWHSGARHG